jgi:hypothetical protein
MVAGLVPETLDYTAFGGPRGQTTGRQKHCACHGARRLAGSREDVEWTLFHDLMEFACWGATRLLALGG